MSRVARVFACCGLVVGLAGCAVPYYWQAIDGQLGLMRQREPIEDLIETPAVDPALKATLTRIAAMRRFAVEELELPDNDSYTTYVALEQPYVVWNVVAAPEFSVDPQRWCFPFAGCVAYRGYFEQTTAEEFAAELAADGLDTHVGGSTAYSTLGYFDDPVLSTMVNGGDQYVASLLFHELAHQKLYVKDDSEFSEAFATVVEELGTERWLMRNGSAADVDRYRQRRDRRGQFGDLVAAQQARLRALYATGAPAEQLRVDKERAFATMRSEYETLKVQWGGSGEYDGWFAQPLNNATLAAVATYTQWLPTLRVRARAVGLAAFYRDTEALAKLEVEERAERLRTWTVDGGASAAR
jgi:predicted aminopeptidase